jgi:glutamine amidotransferase-like uncharacterized protein
MQYKDVEVTSRYDGAKEKAVSVECDCGNGTFLVYFVHNHPHLQCTKCKTTHCQGDCKGAASHERHRN